MNDGQRSLWEAGLEASERLTEERLAGELEQELGHAVHVVYGRARTLPVQATREGRVTRVRLHRMFAAAPRPVRAALAAWLRSGRRARRACALLDGFIHEQLSALPPRPVRRVRLRPRGRHHDLEALAGELQATGLLPELADRGLPGITWGRGGRSRARRALHLGSYSRRQDVIRVHPVLDAASVPAWYVRSVLYHELLHAALGVEHGAPHGPLFRGRESALPDHEAARSWEREHLSRLIRAARRGDRPGPLRGPRPAPPLSPDC